MGGISRTVNYKGNRMDIGGHRFFSKSDRVMNWWLRIMPLRRSTAPDTPRSPIRTGSAIAVQRPAAATRRRADDLVMLRAAAPRRIYFLRKLLRLPDHAHRATRCANSGRCAPSQIGISYIACAAPPDQAREEPRRFLHQPLRPRALPHLLQVLHGEGVGRAAATRSAPSGARSASRDSRSPTPSRTSLKKPSARARDGYRAEGHRDLADRAVPLPEVRPRPDVGGRRRAGVSSRAARSCTGWRVEQHRHAMAARVVGVEAVDSAPASAERSAGRLLLLDHAGHGTDRARSTAPVRPQRRARGRRRPHVPRLHHGRPAASN